MFLIPCPYCGERDQSEFAYAYQAHVHRPKDPDRLTDEEWADFVFIRDNPKGLFAERWIHAAGCRRYFNLMRNTATDEILAVYRIDEPQPEVEAALPATPSGEAPIGSGNDAVKVIKPAERGS
jgi:sarcosine oxidase, subunit delta